MLGSVSVNVSVVSSVDVSCEVSPDVFAKSVYRSCLKFSNIFSSNVCLLVLGVLSDLDLDSSGVFLMRILLMSVWTELCVCQYLSSELSRCLSKVSFNVCC